MCISICICICSKWTRKQNRKCRARAVMFVKSDFFYWLIIVLVFLNTAVLTSEHYGQEKWLDDFQSASPARPTLLHLSHSHSA